MIAAKDLFLNTARDLAVLEGPDAASWLAREGHEVPKEWQHLVTKAGNPKRRKQTKEVKPDEDKSA
jgi:hypothetical protein